MEREAMSNKEVFLQLRHIPVVQVQKEGFVQKSTFSDDWICKVATLGRLNKEVQLVGRGFLSK